MKTSLPKPSQLSAILFLNLSILLSFGCQKKTDTSIDKPVCRLVQKVAGDFTIAYTWTSQNITKAEAINGNYSTIFEYNSNNKISSYKVYVRPYTVPDDQYDFFYNSDGTYSKIEWYSFGKLEGVFEFQNSNGSITKIIDLIVDENGQVDPEPWTTYEFTYAGNNVSKIIKKTRDGFVITSEYTYDSQPNYLRKIHEQFAIIDYTPHPLWDFQFNRFFKGVNQNNCTGISTKVVFSNEPGYELAVHYTYKLDENGNLEEMAETTGRVMGRYTYECK